MRNLATLFTFDAIAIKRWFKTQTVSKVLVLFGFGIVSFITALFFYGFSRVFFSLLSSYEQFGKLTANYLIHATIVMMAWFGIGSSFVATLSFVLMPNKQIRYLVTLPVKLSALVAWVFTKTMVISTLLLIVVLAPVAFAYAQIFSLLNYGFIFRFICTLLILTIVINSVGSLLSYLIAPLFQKKTLLVGLLILSLFLLLGGLLLRLIFPPALFSFATSNQGQFNSIYDSLPLVNPYFPTVWMAQILVSPSLEIIIPALLLTIILMAISFAYQSKKFLHLFHHLSLKSDQKVFKTVSFSPSFALIQKDWLSIIRSWQELGYALFLFSMGIFFFLLLSRAHVSRITEKGYSLELTLFAFVWLIFFTTAFQLRLVFPLMAREGISSWYLFSLPLPKNKILFAKTIFALLITLPFFILGIIVWYFLPFAVTFKVYLALVSLATILLLTIIQVLLGSINPQFSIASDPEKISTSTMGLTAFLYSVGITAIFAYELFLMLKNNQLLFSSIVVLILVSLIIPLFLYQIINRFNYEI